MAIKNRRFTAVAAALASSALVLAACSSSDDSASTATSGTETAAATGNGTITAAVAYATTNYHPSTTSSALAMGTNWHVVEGLFEQDMSDYSVYPALSADDEPVEVSDTEYEVTLRDGAMFSDGTPVTTADVVSSFERAMAEGNIYLSMLNFIDSVEAKDDTTVTITLKAPFAQLKERLAIVKIVPESASDEDLTAMPIGSGPYKYESITDEQVTAVPNEHYNGSKPATNAKLIWDVLVDDTARTTAGSSGAADVIENVPADNIPLLEANGMTISEQDGFNLPFLMFNTSKAPFDDARVRQAFHIAIDTESLVENNMSGKATPATSFLPENHPNYSKAATQFDYDPARAEELLAEAGVENLSITLLTTDHTWIKSLAPQIQNNLEAVGIDVNIQSLASASLYADNTDVENATYDVALAPGDPSVFGRDAALLINWWYGDNVWTKQRTFLQSSDPATYQQLRDIMDEAVTVTGSEQQELFNEALDLLAEQAVLYPLFHRTVITAYNADKISDFSAISTTGLSLLGATAAE